MPTFSAQQLREMAIQLFTAAGVPKNETEEVAFHLVDANLAGHDSHGVIRIPRYLEMIRKGLVQPGAPIEIVKESPAAVVLNGNWGFGQVVAKRAMEIAIERAATAGSCAITAYNSNHIGRLGAYPLMAVERNMIGMVMVNNHGGGLLMAPFGGRARRMSPNPIAFAAPTKQGAPFLMDITSSMTAGGKIMVKRNRKEPLPEGWIIDAEGNPSTDPQKFYGPPEGAILPLGGSMGHKGFALAMMVEILCGALSEAGCSRKDAPRVGNGIFAFVLNPTHFTEHSAFLDRLEALITFIKSSPTLPGFEEILIPGEPEFRTQQRRAQEGIWIEDTTWEEICAAGKELGVQL